MIAVVGHTDLTGPTLELLEAELRTRLAAFTRAGRAGLVRAGQGLPLIAGRAARAAGLALETVLPSRQGLPDMLRTPDHKAAGELLMLSRTLRLFDFDPADRASCVRADESLLRACARVLAVWDGSAADGRDTTAHLVAFARARGIRVDVLWPDGARRAGA
ncbi:hypothetical protein [Streptomyces sp. NPDC004267]|uniref:hypothetical protein n=1 Tax=Streptomyces sp. NPDC004267 TaxID=3364694 RepID=UPI003683C9C2